MAALVRGSGGLPPCSVTAARTGASVGTARCISADVESKSFRPRKIPPLPNRQVFEANVADPDPL